MAAILVVVVAATAALSAAVGALAHRNIAHSLAVGYYVVGVGALIGCFVFGLRGPMRRELPDQDSAPSGQSLWLGRGPTSPRKLRRTTAEERSEARRNSLLLFAFGILLLVIGTAIDPTRKLV